MTHRGLSSRSLLARHPPVVVVLLAVALLGGIVFAFAACQSRRPSPLPTPGPPSRIDLSGWKLSIPVPNKKGSPTLLEPAYTVDPWMVADPTGGLMFWAPANGVSTENSENPRTELNSLTTFNAGQNARTLRASVTLLQVPEDGEGIILGQIHGTDDISSVPYVMLRYQKDQVKVVVKQVQDRDDHINYTLLEDVPLNTRFDFKISDLGTGEMTFSATRDGKTEEVKAPVPAPFMGATVRFQAGDYQQADKPGGAKDGGRVIFHRLAEAPGAAP